MIRYFVLLLLATRALGADWKTAEPDWQYEFPRDHHAHRDFKTEWWYFTGNVFDERGSRFGYELTFFRQGLRSPAQRDPNLSRFITNDLKFAHFTLTDVAGRKFRFEQKTSRGAFRESGFDDGTRIAWIDQWTLALNENGMIDLLASTADMTAHFHLRPLKAPVVHGQNGISAKASSAGHASHYYSITRCQTTGELHTAVATHPIRGESWFDHEWATNQLAPGQIGWNWMCVQWEDGTELMLYQMRLENGEADPSSSGTLIADDGASKYLPSSTFVMTPTAFWKSETSSARYPVSWKIEIPEEDLSFTIRPVLDNQELALIPLTYWEGAIDAIGTRGGKAIKGRGYLELTGYAGGLHELSR
ncbi:MAG: carotenoid 1,2-hydratase [Verrucomicrobiota bacterium]|nr:carotenoid 1,2-hydratase [Verrucomicrobiota bacterium]